ncbi:MULTISPECIES: hypothetical protein [Mesorhizobium]|uniref:Uncharacterized protein n=1 Tax=Mesorhizobium shonense TaxID=1209948 RepID=A0ABV2HLJ1_9HYPH|nr:MULTISPECIES: hypothetical protein [unclassified Mesorhizobium]AZO31649.1 hypothetical protein EJ071_32520 [Mesorhizobium sp. M1B.F.Ca.ET.045.04.1.1]RWA82029.1 MAG: hypothetical protein EOQ30_16550 [Mesorhizobium sp.]RWB20597.1 MAG: hypothetical protein EOQ40_14805 [Mesorhizobium sp.]TIS49034.1 MAG: hypothetical protein E5W96_14880 [Mesorhizobium sp.]TIT97686.1 MAG: hypothetical protein E5W55_08355 [Mesorhizobium sp.]
MHKNKDLMHVAQEVRSGSGATTCIKTKRLKARRLNPFQRGALQVKLADTARAACGRKGLS